MRASACVRPSSVCTWTTGSPGKGLGFGQDFGEFHGVGRLDPILQKICQGSLQDDRRDADGIRLLSSGKYHKCVRFNQGTRFTLKGGQREKPPSWRAVCQVARSWFWISGLGGWTFEATPQTLDQSKTTGHILEFFRPAVRCKSSLPQRFCALPLLVG